MQIKINTTKIEQIKTQLLAIGYFEDGQNTLAKKFDKQLNNSIEKAEKQKEFSGELLHTKILSTLGRLPFDQLLLVGLGKQKEFTIERLRRAAATAVLAAKNLGVKQYATNLQSVELNKTLEEKICAVTQATILATYQFIEYKTVDKNKIKFIDIFEIAQEDNTKEAENALKKSKIITQAVCLARDMVNHPACVMTPQKIAEIAKTLPKQVKVTIHDKKTLEKMGMNAILAVNKGSVIEPKLIILEYSAGKGKPIALVGKGVTFDSGGLDIKTADGMETMKTDMAGAATVLATIKAAAELDLRVNLVGVLPCTENMPGANAYKPGDVIKTLNGKTIEVLNTDAEGRVILADALCYAEKFSPSHIIDLATLTGACVIALGNNVGGIMGQDFELIQDLIESGDNCGEKIWELPLLEEFKEAIKSDIADIRNISTLGRAAGAITGATFLSNFVEKTPWAHLDIAGPAFCTEDQEYLRKGATGFGVRLLIDFLSRTK